MSVGAAIGSSEKIPLLVGMILGGACTAWVSLHSFWRVMRIRKDPHHVHDVISQRGLFSAMAVAFVYSLGMCLSMYMGQFLIQNNSGITVGYAPYILQIVMSSSLVYLMTIYLAHTFAWIDSLWWAQALAGLSYLAFSYVSDISRYMWWVFGFSMGLYIIKCLWVYRRRSTTGGIILLVWLSLGYIVEPMSMLFGVCGTMSISYLVEVWWIVAFKFVVYVVPSIIAGYTMYDQGNDIDAWMTVNFRTLIPRCLCDGYPGDFLLQLPVFRSTAYQKATNKAYEDDGSSFVSAQQLGTHRGAGNRRV